ncbi:MAG: hypothetical protein ACOYO1_18265 [Bacteroidales bacterium]
MENTTYNIQKILNVIYGILNTSIDTCESNISKFCIRSNYDLFNFYNFRNEIDTYIKQGKRFVIAEILDMIREINNMYEAEIKEHYLFFLKQVKTKDFSKTEKKYRFYINEDFDTIEAKNELMIEEFDKDTLDYKYYTTFDASELIGYCDNVFDYIANISSSQEPELTPRPEPKEKEEKSKFNAPVFALFLNYLMNAKYETHTREAGAIKNLCVKYKYKGSNVKIRNLLYAIGKDENKDNPSKKHYIEKVIKHLKEFPRSLTLAENELKIES